MVIVILLYDRILHVWMSDFVFQTPQFQLCVSVCIVKVYAVNDKFNVQFVALLLPHFLLFGCVHNNTRKLVKNEWSRERMRGVVVGRAPHSVSTKNKFLTSQTDCVECGVWSCKYLECWPLWQAGRHSNKWPSVDLLSYNWGEAIH